MKCVFKSERSHSYRHITKHRLDDPGQPFPFFVVGSVFLCTQITFVILVNMLYLYIRTQHCMSLRFPWSQGSAHNSKLWGLFCSFYWFQVAFIQTGFYSPLTTFQPSQWSCCFFVWAHFYCICHSLRKTERHGYHNNLTPMHRGELKQTAQGNAANWVFDWSGQFVKHLTNGGFSQNHHRRSQFNVWWGRSEWVGCDQFQKKTC